MAQCDDDSFSFKFDFAYKAERGKVSRELNGEGLEMIVGKGEFKCDQAMLSLH